jgi:hypothetical protein
VVRGKKEITGLNLCSWGQLDSVQTFSLGGGWSWWERDIDWIDRSRRQLPRVVLRYGRESRACQDKRSLLNLVCCVTYTATYNTYLLAIIPIVRTTLPFFKFLRHSDPLQDAV